MEVASATFNPHTETVLNPELPICDPHHHLWDRIHESYSLEDLIQDISSGHKIVSTVAIECKSNYRNYGPQEMIPVGETEFLEDVATQAKSNPSISPRVAAGIVGYADLTLGDAVVKVLEAHITASPKHFRGIRYSTNWDGSGTLRNDAPPGLLADKMFRRGFDCLRRYDLNFDACIYHPQLTELANLAHAFPDVTIILNHIGAPLGVGPYAGKRNEVFRVWSDGIDMVADCANIVVKLGGLGSRRSGFDWQERTVRPTSLELAQAVAPYFEYCIEKFGVHRCMFESNFPVEKRANSYLGVWNAFKCMTQDYNAAERKALFYDTAVRVYRLTEFPAVSQAFERAT